MCAAQRSRTSPKTAARLVAAFCSGQGDGVTLLASIETPTSMDGVALLDATWQDYPRWESNDDLVAFKAPSLADPETPPYPGFAVRTRTAGRPISTELRVSSRPKHLWLLHENLIWIGLHGVELGNAEDSIEVRSAPSGVRRLEIWVDRKAADEIDLVAFVLSRKRV